MLRRFRIVFVLLAFGLVLLAIPNVKAQSPRERHERIRASIDARDLSSAINDLQVWRSTQPDIFVLNNYDYLLARLSERNGDRANAAVNYQKVMARNSILSEYAIWHLAQFARMTGNLTLEREQLRQLIVTAPKSLLLDVARLRIAQSFFESGDFDGAIYELKARIASSPATTSRESLSLLAQAYARNNQIALARDTFNKLISDLADASRPDDYSLAAVRGLDAIDNGSGELSNVSAPLLAEAEHLRRAKIYHFNRDFAHARLHYARIVRGYPQSPGVPDALYQIGRSFYQDGLFEDAISNLSRVLGKFPDAQVSRDAQGLLASSFGRLKRTDDAVAGYRKLIEGFPNSPEPERPFLNIVDVLRDAGRDNQALEWIERTRERFKGQLPAVLALFSRAKIYVAQSNWARALTDLEALRSESDLGGSRVPGGTSSAEVSYLRALVFEQMGRNDDALRAYLEIPDGRGEYYGGRATDRLRVMANRSSTRNVVVSELERLRLEARKASQAGQPEKSRIAAQAALRLADDPAIASEVLEVARIAYVSLPSYNSIPTPKLLPKGRIDVLTSGTPEHFFSATSKKIADELLFLGLADEGMPALDASENVLENQAGIGNTQTEVSRVKPASRPAASLSLDEAYTRAVLFKRGELADHSIRYAEPLWKNVPRDYLLELAPREMVELLYPAPYSSELNKTAPRRGVDPRFVLAIMRQESRFRADAKSVSAARGLMQFIPATADDIAAQLRKQNFRQDALYDPGTAILFGSQYLGNLFKQFPGMPHAVAASYNGGEDNVARWIARARSNDPDHYVPEIGFAQSKDYVYKVMSNFRVYQKLYGEELQPR